MRIKHNVTLIILLFSIILINHLDLCECKNTSSTITPPKPTLKNVLRNLYAKVNISYLNTEKFEFKRTIDRMQNIINKTRNTTHYQIAMYFKDSMIYFNDFYESALDCLDNSTCTTANQNNFYHQMINSSSNYHLNLLVTAKSTILLEPGIFEILLETCTNMKKETDDAMCDSLRGTLKSIFNMILVNYIRNYMMTIYVLRHRTSDIIVEEGPLQYIDNMQSLSDNVKQDLYWITTVAIHAISSAPKDVRVRDPPAHKKHITYERLTNFMQAWVGSEEYLNENFFCGSKCSLRKTYFHDMIELNENVVQYHPSLKINNGVLHDCYIAPLFHYIYKQIDPPDHDRLYHHLEYISPAKNYSFGNILLNRFSRLEKFSRDNVQHQNTGNCEICLCFLDRTPILNSTRSFSSVPVAVAHGEVVTGVRWAVRKSIVYLELRGHAFDGVKGTVSGPGKWYRTSEGVGDSYETITLGYEQRSMCLDDVVVPAEMVVIGAKFVLVDGNICLALWGISAIDRTTTNNNGNQSTVKFYAERLPDKEKVRRELELVKPAPSEWAPANTVESNQDQSTGQNRFIKFQPTDLYKDASQTVVPYLDIQEVVTSPPTALQGIGIYYRGAKGFGGFVALKLLMTDIEIAPDIYHEFDRINVALERSN